MKRILKTGCWTAVIAAGFLFLGAASVQAQVRPTNISPNQNVQARSGPVNPNLLRQNNLTRPVRQPMQTLKAPNNGINNGLGQQNFNSAINGFNPGMYQGSYPGMYQGGYPGMYQGGYPGMYQGVYPGMYNPGMMYPGYYGYYGY